MVHSMCAILFSSLTDSSSEERILKELWESFEGFAAGNNYAYQYSVTECCLLLNSLVALPEIVSEQKRSMKKYDHAPAILHYISNMAANIICDQMTHLTNTLCVG